MVKIVIKSPYGDKVVQIDNDDLERVSQFSWHIRKIGNHFYVIRREMCGDRRCVILLHRFILGITDPTMIIDHIDHDGLNNTKDNLRIVSYSINAQNMLPYGASKYSGVSMRKACKKKSSFWYSRIKHSYKSYWLGQFPMTPCGELLAAIRYDEKAVELFGSSANVNFK